MVLVGGCSGERLVELLAAEHVPTERIPIAGAIRESFTTVETTTGRQYRFVLPGPTIEPAEFTAACARIVELARGRGLVVLSGSLPPGITADDFGTLLRRIRTVGAEVIVDASGDALGRRGWRRRGRHQAERERTHRVRR